MTREEFAEAMLAAWDAPHIDITINIKEWRKKRTYSPETEAKDQKLADRLTALQAEGEFPFDLPLVAVTDLRMQDEFRRISPNRMARALIKMGGIKTNPISVFGGAERMRVWIVDRHKELDDAAPAQLASIFSRETT